MEVHYPNYNYRLRNNIALLSDRLPREMEAFTRLHKSATADGAISRKTKELIALGVAMTVNCDGCIAYHVKDALEAGATPDEIVETIGVVVMMGGGPAVVYGSQALEALEQFLAERRADAAVPAL